MRVHRLLIALAGVLVVLTAGCTQSHDGSSRSAAAWARGQDHVARAVPISYDDPSSGSFLRITLEHGLSDAQVHKVVHGIKAHFDALEDQPSLEVDVDGFRASVYPGLVTFEDGISDPDLERALWLRRDGRATGYADRYESTVSSHPVVTAPASEVAQLAIDYDAAVTHEHDVRRTESVESPDGTTGVQWSTADSLGFTLDAHAVGEFARLQAAYPGTTGWVDCDGLTCKASIHFAPTDLPLRRVLAGHLVDTSLFDKPEIGWGPALAPAGDFAKTYRRPALRRQLDDLRGVAGVAEVSEYTVVVRTRAAFEEVRRYTQHSGHHLDVSLQREPVLYGFPTQPVLTSRFGDSAALVSVYTAVADLPGITRLDLADNYPLGNLTVDDDVTVAELRTAFGALADLPRPYRETAVYGSVAGDYGSDTVISIGDASSKGFRRAGNAGKGGVVAHPELVKRVEQVWQAVRPRH